jgi:demethylmenaquinone methyltransferase / 2-methoxy-6-polyprenyl-1,4-benzoquinol methylase
VTLPQGDEKTRRVRAMFDEIAPRYEFVNHLTTLGLDVRWRRRAVRDLHLPAHSLILDVASGTGDFLREATAQGYRTVGADLSFGMIKASVGAACAVQADATRLPFGDAVVDGVTCGYALRNFSDLDGALLEMARVVRPGGRVVILEVAEPTHTLWRAGFRAWFRHVVPAIGGLVSDREAYRYLPASTAYLPDAAEIRERLNRAGFVAVNHRLILGGLSQQFLATRSG